MKQAIAVLSLSCAALFLHPTVQSMEPPDGAKDAKAWWPQFLGVDRNGMSAEKNLNTDWKKTLPKVVWKVPLGDGFSSFAIVGERAYTMCQRKGRCIVVCLDTTNGKELWTHDVSAGYVDKQKQGPGPRATPTYHDGRLYCLMPMGELVCLAAADGARIWSADQFKDTGAANLGGVVTLYWGVTISPLVEGHLVIVQPGGDKMNSIAAYHKDTGKLVWMTGDDRPGYGSPQAVTIAGQRQLIVPTGKAVMGLEPTKGTVLWRYELTEKLTTSCCTPVWVDGLLFVSAAYKAGAAVLQITRQGEKWTVSEKWKNTQSLQTLYANAMIVDGHIYGTHGDLQAIFLKCADLHTGEVKWEQRLDGRHWLLAVDGHLLSWSQTGSLELLETTPKAYVLKASMEELLAYKSWAAPAFADGRLYLRDQRNAICVDLRKP